jgi:hypothetical protein
VFFENQPTATAPAQKVVVTDQLDPTKVDLSTFSLGPITVGALTMIPTPGLTQYIKDVDLRPTQNVIARTVAKLDKSTGLLTVTFSSLDPGTLEETQDPTLGFLPPNAAPPAGEGSVTFSVKPRSGIASGTSVCNQAVVVFDTNPAISTPTWCNTTDSAAPVSAVALLPASQSQATFTVKWAGSDAGSGVATYTVYTSDNGDVFTSWQLNTANTSASFTGQPGHTYGFYSIATDNVGNTEPAKSSAETMTTVSSGNAAPVVTLQPANQTVKAGTRATFTAGASGTPSPTVQWQVSTDNGVTFVNIAGSSASTLTFVASSTQSGNKYRAMFTNAFGIAATTAAVLTVNTPPIVTQNPANETVTDGATVTFVAAAAGSPIPTLQWQLSTNSGVSFTSVAGATSKSITFTVSAMQNGNQYRAVFTNTAGIVSTTAAMLTVKIRGDVNGDGMVNCADLAIVKASFGKKLGQPGFNPDADVNGDGVVNILDLSMVAKQVSAGTVCK